MDTGAAGALLLFLTCAMSGVMGHSFQNGLCEVETNCFFTQHVFFLSVGLKVNMVLNFHRNHKAY